MRRINRVFFPDLRLLLLTLLFLPLGRQAGAQDWVRTGTNLGAARIRLAAADFNPGSPDVGPLKTTFDTTLFPLFGLPDVLPETDSDATD